MLFAAFPVWFIRNKFGVWTLPLEENFSNSNSNDFAYKVLNLSTALFIPGNSEFGLITINCKDSEFRLAKTWSLHGQRSVVERFLLSLCMESKIFWFYAFQMSPRLLSFLQRTLVRDPAQRASAFELLNHPFIRSTSNSSSLADMMKSFRHSVC